MKKKSKAMSKKARSRIENCNIELQGTMTLKGDNIIVRNNAFRNKKK